MDIVSFFITYRDIWNHHMVKYLCWEDQHNLFKAKTKTRFLYSHQCMIPWCRCGFLGLCSYPNLCDIDIDGFEAELLIIVKKFPTQLVQSIVNTGVDLYQFRVAAKVVDQFVTDYNETARIFILSRKKEQEIPTKKIKLEKTENKNLCG